MTYPQGGVVLAEDPFGSTGERPYAIVSNRRHPFHGEEYVALVVTTTRRDQAIPLPEGVFEEGSLPRQSYLSPWNPVTLKDWMIDKRVATVNNSTVDDAVEELTTYVETL